MLGILVCYQTIVRGIMPGPNPVQWDSCQRTGGNMSKERGVCLTVVQPALLMRSRNLKGKAPHCGMRYRCFSVSETFNAILTSASFSAVKSFGHSREWLFSLPLICVWFMRCFLFRAGIQTLNKKSSYMHVWIFCTKNNPLKNRLSPLQAAPTPVQVPLSRQTRVAEPTRW